MIGADLKREVRVSFTFWDCPSRTSPSLDASERRTAPIWTIDSGWREVADNALGFVKRFVPSRQEAGAQHAG